MSLYHNIEPLVESYNPCGMVNQDVSIDDIAAAVADVLRSKKLFEVDVINKEVDYFVKTLVGDYYLKVFPVEEVANHVTAFISAKLIALMSSREEDIDTLQFAVKLLPPYGSAFFCPSVLSCQLALEKQIESHLEACKAADHQEEPEYGYSLKTFRSTAPGVPGGKYGVTMHFLHWSKYCSSCTPTRRVSLCGSFGSELDDNEETAVTPRSEAAKSETAKSEASQPGRSMRRVNSWKMELYHEAVEPVSLHAVATENFMRTKPEHAVKRYQKIINEFLQSLCPVYSYFPDVVDGANLSVLTFVFDQEGKSHICQITELLAAAGLTVVRSFVETFSNDIEVYAVYIITPEDPAVTTVIFQNATLLGLMPHRSLKEDWADFSSRRFSPMEALYIRAASVFTYYFCLDSDANSELKAVQASVAGDALSTARLLRMHDRLSKTSEDRIVGCVTRYPNIIANLWDDFQQRVFKGDTARSSASILKQLKDQLIDQVEWNILKTFLTFNTSVVKTNFNKVKKAALSFRLDTSFLKGNLNSMGHPFGMFMVLGAQFRGFHIRFADVARGGIRLIRSATPQAYANNKRSLIDENLGLAWTQQLKNKDIPEGGSKGTILVAPTFKGSLQVIFDKYVDAMLDLLLPNSDPGIVDLTDKEELLFFGPDEGTANFMSATALQARARGYKYWKAFTTGKSPDMGGIPHDTYGMTTQGVRTYQWGIMEKLNLKEEECTKLQIGGPDGDLGSNEILMSKDRTIGVVDGSGVLYDPAGLNRGELVRLARSRKTIDNFNEALLSSDGFKVLCSESGVKLPNGFIVENGFQFRNMFHVNPIVTADFFVPCGGRPKSIDSSNVDRLLGDNKQHKFKYIVEGANLFITEDARMQLEDAGIIVYKDASANKGGVTSSSLEVLAGLAMTDDEFTTHMCVDGTKVPDFYKRYVEDVQQIIRSNARAEFELLWKEYEAAGGKVTRTVLTNQLSRKINDLTDDVSREFASTLSEDDAVLRSVLSKSLPRSLLELLGLEKIMHQVPNNYLHSIFSAYIASKYVYRYGLHANDFAFYAFMKTLE